MAEFDFDAAAQRLFGATTTPPVPSEQSQDATMAERLFGAPAAAQPAPAQTNEPATRLYTGDVYGDARRAVVSALAEAGTHTPTEASEAMGEHEPLMRSLDLNSTEASTVVDAALAVGRGVDATAWEEMSLDAIRADFGPTRTAEVLRRCQEYVAARPALRDLLAANPDLGNHPAVVRLVAQRAMK